MTAGELYVSLGVKGADKTMTALGSIKNGLTEAKSVSLEMKAALVGAMYALERVFAKSGAVGTGMTNFTALTGLSAKTLQQWQYAARQMGASSDDVTSSIMAIQKAMAGVDLNKGVPEGLMLLSQAAGGIDFRKKDDPFYMMAAFQKAVHNLGNSPRAKAIENYLVSSMGINPAMIAAMQRNAFNEKAFKAAPIYSDKELGNLDKANIGWSNLSNEIEMAFGHFNAKHGTELVKEFTTLTRGAEKFAESLEHISEKFKVIETAGHALEGIGNTFKLIGEIMDKFQGKESKKGDLLYTPPGQEAVPGFKDSPVGHFLSAAWGAIAPGSSGPSNIEINPAHIPVPAEIARPNTSHSAHTTNRTTTFNQQFHYQHDGKDSKKNASDMRKVHQDAYRQFDQGRVN